jgi:hypothetical protein
MEGDEMTKVKYIHGGIHRETTLNIMFLRGPCVEGLVLRLALLEGGRTFRRWGLVEES